MSEAVMERAGDGAALVSLSSLWTALAPRQRAVAPLPPDVGQIAAAAEAEGAARGRAEAEAELAPQRDALARAIAAVEAAAVIDPATLQPLFAALVGRVAAAVVDGELRQSGEAVERLVAAALAAVDDEGGVVLRVSADDAARLASLDTGSRVEIDPDLAPGEIRVETPYHVVAASLGARLAGIVAGLA